MRLSQEASADFHAAMSLGRVESAKDSERRECVLINETTLESSEGFEKGRFSSGRWSLMRV